jgi:murein lipoprotein
MQKIAIPRGVFALALGVPLLLAGCATRSSVEQAQNSANLADQHAGAAATAAANADSHAASADSHAGAAQARADEAAGIGNNAMTAAQTADQKATAAQAGLIRANARISYLERHLMPKHFAKIHHKVKPKKQLLKPSGT